MKLDRSKPFAQTIGDSVARYHQGGRDFDSSGNEIVQPEQPEPVKRKPGRPPKVNHDLES